jgi:hypothetical protein
MKTWIKYLLWGIVLTTIIDFTNTLFPDFQAWFSNLLAMFLLFYLLFPLFCSFLIYKLKLRERTLFIVITLTGLLAEIILFKTSQFFNPIEAIFATVIGISTYNLLIFLPKWIVEKRLKENKKWLRVMLIIWFITMILTIINHI